MLLRRLGWFALLVGLLSWLIFLLSELARIPEYNYFFLGLVCLLFAIIVLRLTAPPPPEGPRYFRTVRRMLQRKSKEEKRE